MVDHFREAGCDAVLSMWRSQTNEDGQRLSSFESEALIERHCELFGTWPDLNVRYGQSAAELELTKFRIAEGKQLVAEQRRRIAERERIGGDTQLSKRLLVTFEASLRLMIGYGRAIEWLASGIGPDCHVRRANKSSTQATTSAGGECAGLSSASYRHRACSTHGRTSGFASPTQGKSRMS
jgi:hypothetical protein